MFFGSWANRAKGSRKKMKYRIVFRGILIFFRGKNRKNLSVNVNLVIHCVRGKFLLLCEEKVAADSEYSLKIAIPFRCRMTEEVI